MPRCVVVDSEFIYNLLEDRCPVCDEIVFRSYAKGYPVKFTPTTGHELVDIAMEDKDDFTRRTLPSLRHSAVGLVTLDPVDNDPTNIRVMTGLAQLAAEEILNRGAIKDHHINLAYVLAEAAIVNTAAPIYCLVMEDTIIRSIDQKILAEIWVERHFAKYPILSRIAMLKHLSTS